MGRRRSRKDEANLQPKLPLRLGFKFFKIIHSANIIDKQLGLPKKFVKKFGNYLADVVVLRDPNYKTWHVELRKADGEVWLSKGWEEFVEYYSIGVGQFLEFRYDGSSHFHVVIFNLSGTEILYPCKSDINVQEPSDSGGIHVVAENIMDETDEDESVEILGVSPPNKYALRSKQPENESVPVNISTILSRRKGPFFVPEKTERAIELAKDFKSTHPFCVVISRESYIKNGYAAIPAEFARRYMPKQFTILKLMDSNGRTWPVHYIFSKQASHSRLGKGWITFATENNLKVGEVCVFELINKVDIVLKVSIFRTASM